jgi:hypothetical protein
LKKGRWVSKEANMEMNLRQFGVVGIEEKAQEIGEKIFKAKCAIAQWYKVYKKTKPSRRRGRKAILAEAV